MGNYCCKCGSKLQEQSKFCVYCGSPVMQNQAVQQESSYELPVQQQYTYQNTYGMRQNPAYNGSVSEPKLHHTVFLFVTTLIFMIYFSIRTFVLIVLPGSWDFSSWRILYTILSIAIFSIVLSQFISANGVFKRSNSMEKRKQSSRKLCSLSITAFVLGLVLFLFTIICLANENTYGSSYKLAELYGFMVAFIVFDLIFIVFALINMIKSKKLKEEIIPLM